MERLSAPLGGWGVVVICLPVVLFIGSKNVFSIASPRLQTNHVNIYEFNMVQLNRNYICRNTIVYR